MSLRSSPPRQPSSALRWHPRTASNLADLVRIMNTYYTNLIEGHHTRPRDIERALSGELDQDQKRRDLQLEAKAHLRPPARPNFLGVHSLPPSRVLSGSAGVHAADLGSGPGVHDGARKWRSLPEHDVAVGEHLPPSSNCVPDFMRYFEL